MRHSWILAAMLLTASVASANDDGKHTHDGFYLRLQGGLGYTRAAANEVDLAVKGGSGALNIEIGGALARNFILFGKLSAASSPNPDFELGDITVEGGNSDLANNFTSIGVGLAYYVMPANIYFSGAITASQLSFSEEGETLGETEVGGGLHLGLGKEWWVSDNWGLGIGGELALARIKDSEDTSVNVTSFHLLFSATFN